MVKFGAWNQSTVKYWTKLIDLTNQSFCPDSVYIGDCMVADGSAVKWVARPNFLRPTSGVLPVTRVHMGSISSFKEGSEFSLAAMS